MLWQILKKNSILITKGHHLLRDFALDPTGGLQKNSRKLHVHKQVVVFRKQYRIQWRKSLSGVKRRRGHEVPQKLMVFCNWHRIINANISSEFVRTQTLFYTLRYPLQRHDLCLEYFINFPRGPRASVWATLKRVLCELCKKSSVGSVSRYFTWSCNVRHSRLHKIYYILRSNSKRSKVKAK